MQLREFTLIRPTVDAGQVFKAIETAIPIELIHPTSRNGSDSLRAQSKRQSQR